jgi:hypothetical protein
VVVLLELLVLEAAVLLVVEPVGVELVVDDWVVELALVDVVVPPSGVQLKPHV